MEGDGGIGYLIAAWKLLISGIGLCLFAQLVAIGRAAVTHAHYGGSRVLTHFNRATRDGENTSRSIPAVREVVNKWGQLQQKAMGLAVVAGWAGSSGFVISVTAIYWLYRFAKVNTLHIGR